MLSLALCGPVAEGFVPLEKGDPRGSEATWRPPAAEGAGKLSQSFHSLAKGDKGTPPLSKCTSPRPLVSATGMDRTLVCNNTYCVCINKLVAMITAQSAVVVAGSGRGYQETESKVLVSQRITV